MGSAFITHERPAELGKLERAVRVAREAQASLVYPFDVCARGTQRQKADFLQIFSGEPARKPDAKHAFEILHVWA